jgi:hypothetical protein
MLVYLHIDLIRFQYRKYELKDFHENWYEHHAITDLANSVLPKFVTLAMLGGDRALRWKQEKLH